MSMKMMRISILKFAMELMMIQMTKKKKKKIRTNYQNMKV